MVAPADPILVADVVLDAALAAGADSVVIEPQNERYTIAVARAGELLAVSTIEAQLAIHTIARLGYVCQVDAASTRATTGRTRVRSVDTQRDLVVTIAPGPKPRAELMFVAPGQQQPIKEPIAGERIGHYSVLRRIGAGGMGDVYEVEHVTLRRRAALKILQRDVSESDIASSDRFLLEAQATARIKSAHVVEIYDFGYMPDGRPYFVMELLVAQSLADLLDVGALQIPRALSFARQIVEGLIAAHAQGVIHADVTPMNVLVESDRAKLIDFGLAQMRDQRPTENAESITGTPSYVSPEQLQGRSAVEASDQYSVGCVLFEMLAGRPPFDGDNVTEICIGHVRRPAPRAFAVHGKVTGTLAAVIARCLAKEPEKRYSSMKALAEALAVVEIT